MLASAEAPGLGAALIRTVLALLLVCALAAAVLWGLRRRRGAAPDAPLRVLARLSLEPRRTLYLVAAVGRYLLIGVGDGPMTVLAELDAQAAASLSQADGARVGEALRRVVGA